jgi:hypothetical protein
MPQLTRVSQLDAATLDGSELLLVSKRSATVVRTATTISAQASDNSFNDSGTGFITAGFAVGDAVNVIGFTGNAANNILSGIITALTAGKMTIGGTDGDVIVDDAAGESVTIAKWESRRTTAADLAAGGAEPLQIIPIACSDETTALTAGTNKVEFIVPIAWTLSSVAASVKTAPTGAALQVDINEDTGGGATSILSTKITIDIGEKTSLTAAAPPVLSDTSLAAGSILTIDLDQVGSTVAGAGLKVYLIGRPT